MVMVITVLLTLAGNSAPAAEHAYSPGNLLRLHVVAASDSEVDQQTKLDVRDAVMEMLVPLLGDAHTLDEAREVVTALLPELEQSVGQTLSAAGQELPIRLELGRWEFPVRDYGRLTLPAGQYEAMRITLGEGSGSNWWCLLFPPLCLLELDGAPPEERDAAVAVLSRLDDTGELEYEVVDGTIRLRLLSARAVANVVRDLGGVWRQIEGALGISR